MATQPPRLAEAERLRNDAQRLTGANDDYDALVALAANARFVLLGEASHGTHEFYRERARITQRLIAEHGFCAVALEADWPDALRVNRWVRGGGDDADADAALSGFRRFPTWMWRNTDVRAFVEWLRAYNARPGVRPVGIYGLDLYSMHTSIASVLEYLDRVDPESARRARYRYSCFDHHGDDPQAYGYAASFDLESSCEDEVVAQLRELRARAGAYANVDGEAGEDEFFHAEQNARLVRNAEQYYRSMFAGRVLSWNLRDLHMMESLQSLAVHLGKRRDPVRIVVWAHNSHLGDARATEMGEHGELNLGQLVRQAHGRDALLVGFSTYTGTVSAASNWDEPAQRKRVRPGLPGSYEHLFHELGIERFQLVLRDDAALAVQLRGPRLQRAIGVIYRPESERQSHYFRARVADQFDALLHFDTTRAVEPLEPGEGWHAGEPPETFPSGL